MKTIKLNFVGPFGWFGPPGQVLFDQPIADQSGIYIWGVVRPEGFLVHYVGETGKSFNIRHKGHLRDYMKGRFLKWTYYPKAFKNGKRITWRGLFYEDEKKDELAPKIRSFLDTMSIFVAPTHLEKFARQRIESAITTNLESQPHPIGTFIDPDKRHCGNSGCLSHITIHSPIPILGLSDPLEFWLPG